MITDTEYQASFKKLTVMLRHYPTSMSLNEVHGFLTAVAILGDHIEPLPWRQTLLGMDPATHENDIPDDIYLALEENNLCLVEALIEQSFIPPVSFEILENTRLPKTGEWARGFLQCLGMVKKEWETLLACGPEDLSRQFFLLNVIADPQQHIPQQYGQQQHDQQLHDQQQHGTHLTGDQSRFESIEQLPVDQIKEMRELAGHIAIDIWGYVSEMPEKLDVLREEIDAIVARQSDEKPESLSDAELFDLLKTQKDSLSLQAVEECVRRQDTLLPLIGDYLQEERHWPANGLQEKQTDESWWALVHGIFILGKMIGPQAADVLLQVLNRQIQSSMGPVWERVGDYWSALLNNKMEFAEDRLRQMAQDPLTVGVTRYDILECLLAYAYEGDSQQLEDTIDFIAEVIQGIPHDDSSGFMCINLLLDFPRARHRQLLNRYARESRKYELGLRQQDIKEAFAQGDFPKWLQRTNPWWFYQPGQIAMRRLGLDHEFDDMPLIDFLAEDEDFGEEVDFDPDVFPGEYWENDNIDFQEEDFFLNDTELAHPIHADPFVHQLPKVGRNDPCPCGSGKKYKKCCLH